MIVKVQKPFLNCYTVIAKNITRKYAVPAVTNVDGVEKTLYPPILDMSLRGRLRQRKDIWHGKIKKLESVEEKLFAINMPFYYGWKSLGLQEGKIPYNALPHAQYITRTHVANDDKLPDFYNNLLASEELNILLKHVKKPIEDILAFEYCDRLREKELMQDADDKKKLSDDITNAVTYQINRIILSGLSPMFPHLMEAEVDFNPRVEAFWLVGGIQPSLAIKRRLRKNGKKEFVNDPVDVPIQYLGSPVLQLRHQLPLKEIVPFGEAENSDLSIPQYKYDPRTIGYHYAQRHATSIPGFWPGDPAEFGLLSYHSTNHLSYRQKEYNDNEEAANVQAMFASYSWLLSQACYQGFSTVNDITYPLVSQTVLTNGKWWKFCAYQLNTTLLHSEYADENPVSNMCWITEPMKLFDTVENGKICGFNENVLKHLLMFYMNTPEERMNVVDMKPYLGKSVKHLADIPDVERRTWLEQRFKYIMSNRPRHYEIPEIRTWQKIYLHHLMERPFAKKRDPWQFGYNPWVRRLDDHKPIYIPRCLRENPRKRRIGRWAKSYYPDA